MNPGGNETGSDNAFSVSDLVSRETDELLELVNKDRRFGKRQQETFKALVRHTLLLNPHCPHCHTDSTVIQT
jgi:hypothetical protein